MARRDRSKPPQIREGACRKICDLSAKNTTGRKEDYSPIVNCQTIAIFSVALLVTIWLGAADVLLVVNATAPGGSWFNYALAIVGLLMNMVALATAITFASRYVDE